MPFQKEEPVEDLNGSIALESPSATYYFNVRQDEDIVLDDDGRVLSSADEAMEIAEKLARAAVRQRVLDGLPATSVWIEVADADRHVIGIVSSDDVPLTEATTPLR